VTVDLDRCSVAEKNRVITRILSCPGSADLRHRESAGGNGYHLRFGCRVDDCFLCRMVFDHPRRLDLDLMRPGVSRGVLWDVKHVFKGGVQLRLDAGPWVRHG
jgi:hypothetical protein